MLFHIPFSSELWLVPTSSCGQLEGWQFLHVFEYEFLVISKKLKNGKDATASMQYGWMRFHPPPTICLKCVHSSMQNWHFWVLLSSLS